MTRKQLELAIALNAKSLADLSQEINRVTKRRVHKESKSLIDGTRIAREVQNEYAGKMADLQQEQSDLRKLRLQFGE